jgi:ubiquinone/menaquinone biosynthesis C-methylase UbiE
LTSQDHPHKRFPERLAFMLDNPIRRFLSPPERLISKLDIGSSDVVVDFGCGSGFFLIPLAKAASRSIGVDVSPRMLERAARLAKKEGITIDFLQSDGTEIRLDDGSVDLILLNHVFHEVEDKPGVLGEFHRILKPSGRLAIVERIHGANGLLAKLSPPLIDEKDLAHDIQQMGFRVAARIPYGNSSIVIAQKVVSSPQSKRI